VATLQLRNLPEPLKRKLRKRAAAEGTTMSDYVLALLARELSRPTPLELHKMLQRLPLHEDLPLSPAKALDQARREHEAGI